MREDDRFTNSNFAEVFGALEKTHRVRRGCFEKFGIPSIILGCAVFGFLAYLGSEDWLTIPVCVLPFALLFVMVVWHLYKTRGDELRLYEHGFTYRSGKNLQACLWTDIETCRRRESRAEDYAEIESENFPLGAVEKKNGEIIEFEHELEGTLEIVSRFEDYKARRKSK